MVAKKVKAPVPLVEVRQCQDPENVDYQKVAIKSQLSQFLWFIGSPGSGGYWSNDDTDVAGWTVLTAVVS